MSDCITKQEIFTDICNKFVDKIEKNLNQIIDKVDRSKTDEASINKVKKIDGDIYAIGTAGGEILGGAAKVVDSAGTAGAKVIDSAGGAAKKTLEGAGTAIESTGTAVGSIFEGLTKPLIAGAVVLGLLLVLYLIYKFGFSGSYSTVK